MDLNDFDGFQVNNVACYEVFKISELVGRAGKTPEQPFFYFLDTSKTRAKFESSELINKFDELVDSHNKFTEALKKAKDIRSKTQLDINETTLSYFSPLLFVIAIALRITKVTGEIRLARGKK
jgi:hypothetical protein